MLRTSPKLVIEDSTGSITVDPKGLETTPAADALVFVTGKLSVRKGRRVLRARKLGAVTEESHAAWPLLARAIDRGCYGQ